MKLRSIIQIGLKFNLIVGVMIFVLGCAATAYQPAEGNFAGGYTDIKVGPDMYRISFEGNAYITGEKAYQYTLYRAAEISMANKCKWFEVIDRNEMSRRDWAGFLGYVEKPRNSIVIKLFTEKPSDNAYSAIEIMNSINVK